MIHKHSIQTLFVNNTMVLPTVPAGTPFYGLNGLNILPNQVRFVVPVVNSGANVFADAATAFTTTTTPFMKVIQGRDMTNDQEFEAYPYKESLPVHNACNTANGKITVNITKAKLPANDLQLVGAPNTVVGGNIPVGNEIEYRVTNRIDGVYAQRLGGTMATDLTTYTSPDFTVAPYTAYATPIQQRDFIIKEMLMNYNSSSHFTYAMALSSVPVAAPAITVAAAIALLNGQTFTIGYRYDGTPITVTMDDTLRQSLIALEAEAVAMGLAAGALTIVPYAPSNTSGVAALTYPGMSTVDMFATVALDNHRSNYNEAIHTSNTQDLGVSVGLFTAPTVTTVMKGNKGYGSANSLNALYSSHETARKTVSRKGYAVDSTEYPSGLIAGKYYDTITFMACENIATNLGATSYKPFTVMVAVLNEELTGGAVNPNLAALQNTVNKFLADTGSTPATVLA